MRQRELKFKIWLDYEKCWGDSALLEVSNNGYELVYKYRNTEKYRIVQYTNFKDVNGKEIYEGDIVSRTDTGLINPNTNMPYVEVVMFHPFIPGWTGFGHIHGEVLVNDFDTYRTVCPVIGNIFENSELLGEDNTFNTFKKFRMAAFGLSYDSKNEQ
jgi:hypothetical protein